MSSDTLLQHDVSLPYSITYFVEQLAAAASNAEKLCYLKVDGVLTSHRMDREGLRNYRKAVVIVSVYVAVGYFVVIVCFVGVWCRPFHLYYDTIPVPAGKGKSHLHSISPAIYRRLMFSIEQCMSYRDHMILDACLNTTGDAMMLCLPIPLLVKARLPLNRFV